MNNFTVYAVRLFSVDLPANVSDVHPVRYSVYEVVSFYNRSKFKQSRPVLVDFLDCRVKRAMIPTQICKWVTVILPVAKHLSGLLPNTPECNRNTNNYILSLDVVNKTKVSLYKMHVLQLHTAGAVF